MGCRICRVTHAVLPSFLLGRVHYAGSTLTPYLERAVTQKLSAIQVWQRGLADGPRDSKTLYRWLKRLRPRLAILLPRLKQELMMLVPHTDLTPLKNFILNADFSVPEVPAHTEVPAPMLNPMVLCQCGFWLSQLLLAVSGELLATTPDLTPCPFSIIFAGRKTLSPCCHRSPNRRPPDFHKNILCPVASKTFFVSWVH